MNKFDTSVRPQDDFFGYVNNPWLQANPIPSTETSWGTFYVLRDQSWEALRQIMDELLAKKPEDLTDDQRLLCDLFTSALHFEKNSPQGIQELKQTFRVLDRYIGGERPIEYVLGALHRANTNAGWALYVSQDDRNSTNQVLRFYQGGLNLPNRDYYLDRSERMRQYRQSYKTYYREMQKALPGMLGSFSDVWKVEKQIAAFSLDDIALRDVEKNYTKVTQKKLKTDLKQFNWDSYWEGLQWADHSDDLVVDQYSFLTAATSLFHALSEKELRAYLHWTIVNKYAAWLSPQTAKLSFKFYGTVLSGQKAMKPLWKRVVNLADKLVVGEALGREYVARYFPESSKRAVAALVEDIRAAYHARIERLSWMGDATKKRAHMKLDNIKVFIGYPDHWKNLEGCWSFSDSVIKNILHFETFDFDMELENVGKKPDEEKWEMNAQTVNAYNHPNRLEIVFPGAILQPPFYDPKASRAANLGGIGAVIGHEFTHSFDDEGSKFDEHGNVNSWQTKEERKQFEALAKNIVRLGDAFETVPGVHLQGKLILGEAIADVGGLSLAVEALGDKPDELKDLFVNFATCECGHTTKDLAVVLAKTDPHPPSRFRVNNVVNHVDAFYESYGVTKSDKLYLPVDKRAKIW